ncbi:uncharacterized protein [Epargyreus clarus]|uniref:uncharacterized protein n=1 Tax=Epargyreus clarus TaxID=520877 RepID=UPI003C300018
MKSNSFVTFFSFLFLFGITAEELPTPSNLLAPRNFNYHPYEIKQYLKEVTPEPTKQGPVLFPNDAPPPPRPPLVVTSRPLLQAIAKSDLNPRSKIQNNSIAEQSQVNHVTFKPYLGLPYELYTVAPLQYVPDRVPYEEVLNKVRGNSVADNRYNEYEERTSLPPIYKALSDYAQNKLLKIKQNPTPTHYDYKNTEPDYGRSYENNEVADENDNTEYNQGENYAFSYSVKDKKTGDDFSHTQQSSGSATNGEYRVRLPDGRMQIVSYTADENGYKADVRYDTDDPNHIDYKVKETQNEYKNYNNDYPKPNPVYNYDLNQNDYTQRDFNVNPTKDYNQYESKEYYNDYSLEYPNYDTHRSKFTAFKPTPTVFTTVRPAYEDIKDLFTRKPFQKDYISDRAVEINGPSSPNYENLNDNVVVIAPKLYTNVRSSTPLVEAVTTPKPFIVTPASYLASTIASIKERIKASKPILTNNFINRLNKYLTFT